MRGSLKEIELNMSTLGVLFGKSIFALAPGNVFWTYFAGGAILVAGLFAARKEMSVARGQDRIVTLGRLFFAPPLAVFAAQHFTNTKSVSLLVPSWIPAPFFWTYLVGTALVAAALSIVVKKQARLAAILLAFMLILFVLLLHIPNIVAHPRDVLTWAFAFRDLAFSGGALALAGTQTDKWRAQGTSTLIVVARIFVSLAAIFFGVEHFLHPDFLPAVDLDKLTPPWIPGRALWAYLAGTIFILAGTSLAVNLKPRLAATCLSIMALTLLLSIYVPMVVSAPSDIDNGLDYFVSTLAFSGATLFLAAAMPKKTIRKDHTNG
jgi:uncharacterized membrane protein